MTKTAVNNRIELPPQDLVAERAVLGSIILENRAYDDICDLLSAEHFYSDVHQTVYSTICNLIDNGKPADSITIANCLDDSSLLEEVGGVAFIFDLLEAVSHIANAAYYAEIVRDKWTQRQLQGICQESLRTIRDGVGNGDEILEGHEKSLFALADQKASSNKEMGVRDVMAEAKSVISERADNPAVVSGVSTGYPSLDGMTNGFHEGTLSILAARPAMGKAQPLDSLVLTPSGFIPMGSLSVGSVITGRNGKPTRVTGIYPQGVQPVFRVAMSDKSSAECTIDHLWLTQTRNERRRGSAGSVKTLADIKATLVRDDSGSPNHAIPIADAVEMVPGEALLLHPYLMGLLLGDGSCGPTTVRFFKPEQDVLDRLEALLPEGDTVSVITGGVRIKGNRRRASGTLEAVTRYGLCGSKSHTKFIPFDYMCASVGERLDLLRGLFDTDGHVVACGSVEFTTSSARMAAQVQDLVRGLGGQVVTSVRVPVFAYLGEKKKGIESHRMLVKMPPGVLPVSSRKHLAKWRNPDTRHHRSIVSIEPSGERECQCISVESPDQLYITDNFIVTHNTAFVCNLIDWFTINGSPAMLFSMEQSKQELAERLICIQSRVDGHAIRKGHLTAVDRHAVLDAASTIAARGNLFIDDTAGRSMAEIRSICRRVKRKHGLKVIVIDYLQLIEPEDKKANREVQVATISRRLKGLAKDMKCPVICLSQLNRAVELREDKRPKLADLRESGAIEQDADIVMFLHRPGAYNPEDRPNLAEVIIAKHRSGPIGIAELTWRGSTMRFEDGYADEGKSGVDF